MHKTLATNILIFVLVLNFILCEKIFSGINLHLFFHSIKSVCKFKFCLLFQCLLLFAQCDFVIVSLFEFWYTQLSIYQYLLRFEKWMLCSCYETRSKLISFECVLKLVFHQHIISLAYFKYLCKLLVLSQKHEFIC